MWGVQDAPAKATARTWRERQSRATAEMRVLWIADIRARKAEKVKPPAAATVQTYRHQSCASQALRHTTAPQLCVEAGVRVIS